MTQQKVDEKVYIQYVAMTYTQAQTLPVSLVYLWLDYLTLSHCQREIKKERL